MNDKPIRCAACIARNAPVRYSRWGSYCDACGYAMKERKNGAEAHRADAEVVAIIDFVDALCGAKQGAK